jgi:hypothetical protein
VEVGASVNQSEGWDVRESEWRVNHRGATYNFFSDILMDTKEEEEKESGRMRSSIWREGYQNGKVQSCI